MMEAFLESVFVAILNAQNVSSSSSTSTTQKNKLPISGNPEKSIPTIHTRRKTMFASLKKIFGIPAQVTAASQNQAVKTFGDVARYLPASQVPENGIEGVAVDGSTWLEWRIDRTSGEQWYERLSYVDSVDARPPEIHAMDEQIDEEFDELEQAKLSREMFDRHILRARERALDNPFGIREYHPDDDREYDPDEPYESDEADDDE
jgi:hypothetical protein